MRFLTLFFLFICYLEAREEFILSYRIFIKNSLLVHEQFYPSTAMTPTNEQFKEICSLKKDKNSEISKKEFLIKKKEEILNCLQKENIYVNAFFETINFKSDTTTILTIPPIRFTVDFKDDFAKISTILPKTDSFQGE